MAYSKEKKMVIANVSGKAKVAVDKRIKMVGEIF